MAAIVLSPGGEAFPLVSVGGLTAFSDTEDGPLSVTEEL